MVGWRVGDGNGVRVIVGVAEGIGVLVGVLVVVGVLDGVKVRLGIGVGGSPSTVNFPLRFQFKPAKI